MKSVLSQYVVGEAPEHWFTDKQWVVADALLRFGSLDGKSIGDRSGGGLGRGTLYATLHRMVELGMISQVEKGSDGTPGRRGHVYSLTPSGKASLKGWCRAMRRYVG